MNPVLFVEAQKMIVKPVLFVQAQEVGDAVTFYKSAFDAVEVESKRKLHRELPHVISAEITLAGTTIVIRDVSGSSGSTAKSEVNLYIKKKPEVNRVIFDLETENLKAAVAKAFSTEAFNVAAIEVGGVEKVILTDPFGFRWILSSPGNIDSEDPEDLIISNIRDMVMEKIKHFQEFSSLMIQRAIDGFVYRGPDFPERPDLKRFVGKLKEMADDMDYWIQNLMDSVDEDDEMEVDKDDDVDDAEETDEEAYEVEAEEWVGYFHRHIDSARRHLLDIKSHGSVMMRLCPTLDTLKELTVLNEQLEDLFWTVEMINNEQRMLEYIEEQLNW